MKTLSAHLKQTIMYMLVVAAIIVCLETSVGQVVLLAVVDAFIVLLELAVLGILCVWLKSMIADKRGDK